MDLATVSLSDLKLPQLRTLCVQARKDGHLEPTVKCNGTRAHLLALLTEAQDNLTHQEDELSDDEEYDSSSHGVHDVTNMEEDILPSTRYDGILSSIPHEILTIIATYIIDYGKVLALLAAYPANTDLVRALYSPYSPFWSNRLGALTGKGALVTMDGITTSTDAPWTPRDQHHAILPRGGFLTSSVRYVEKMASHTLDPVPTKRRVRQAIDISNSRVNVRYSAAITLIALGDDDVLRYMDMNINPMYDYRVSDDVRYLNVLSAVENGVWEQPYFYPAPSGTNDGTVPLPIAPRIARMVRVGYSIIALDVEGRLWLFYRRSEDVHAILGTYIAFVELTLPPEVVEEEGVTIVRHIVSVPVYTAIQKEITDRMAMRCNSALVVTVASGRDYIVDIAGADKLISPHKDRQVSFYSVPDDTYRMLGMWGPDPLIDQRDVASGDVYDYPLVPQMLLYHEKTTSGTVHPARHASTPSHGVLDDRSTTTALINIEPRQPALQEEVVAMVDDILAENAMQDGASARDIQRLAILPKWSLGNVGSTFWSYIVANKTIAWHTREESPYGPYVKSAEGLLRLYLLERNGMVWYMKPVNGANVAQDGLVSLASSLIPVDPVYYPSRTMKWYGGDPDTVHSDDRIIFTDISALSWLDDRMPEGDWVGISV